VHRPSLDQPLPELLHHYTNEYRLVGIIESQVLWATHVGFLNDESEVRYSRELLGALVQRLRSEFDGDWAGGVVCDVVAALAAAPTSLDTYIASLCDDGDNLGQWRGYGDYAIGFHRERLSRVAHGQDCSLIRVIYDEAEQTAHLEQAIRDAIPIMAGWASEPSNAPSAEEQLLLLGIGVTIAALWIKNPFFRDEREWRLDHVAIPGLSDARVRTRLVGDVSVPYEVISLVEHATGDSLIAEIVLGPLVRSDESEADVRHLLDANGLTHVPIRRSTGPLRR